MNKLNNIDIIMQKLKISKKSKSYSFIVDSIKYLVAYGDVVYEEENGSISIRNNYNKELWEYILSKITINFFLDSEIYINENDIIEKFGKSREWVISEIRLLERTQLRINSTHYTNFTNIDSLQYRVEEENGYGKYIITVSNEILKQVILEKIKQAFREYISLIDSKKEYEYKQLLSTLEFYRMLLCRIYRREFNLEITELSKELFLSKEEVIKIIDRLMKDELIIKDYKVKRNNINIKFIELTSKYLENLLVGNVVQSNI